MTDTSPEKITMKGCHSSSYNPAAKDKGDDLGSQSCAYCSHSKRLLPSDIDILSKEDPELFDRQLHSIIENIFNCAPPSIANTVFDWFVNLAFSPGKQTKLLREAIKKSLDLGNYQLGICCNLNPEPCTTPLPQDRRFEDEGWKHWPYNIYQQSFLLTQDWWTEATRSVRGVSQHHSELFPFLVRQYLDAFSPLNFPWTNPVVIKSTQQEMGENYIRGAQNFIEDVTRFINGEPPVGAEKYQVGVNIATTKGKVIYQNRLIELIQYSPVTETAYKDPILIVPAWIMKYYILDLSPQNSLVRYLIEQGHTVFIISWKNPESDDANLGLEDYLNMGIMESLDVISKLVPDQKINAAGYCLGGTLLAIAAAKLARDKDERLRTVTLFAAQVDFEEAGELLFFIDEVQLAYLEDTMSQKGYLEASRMAGTFYMLRSYDLIWSRIVEEYLLGKREEMIDLMAWNADATRMPYKMQSEYLRLLFLNNDLSAGRFEIDSEPITLADINVPLFVVSTQKDHVSPWESVYKIHLFVDTDITFVLTSGGHNAGIVSEPGHPHRNFQIMTHKKDETHLSHEEWGEKAEQHEGSWWPSWHEWLIKGSGKKSKPPAMGNAKLALNPLRDAPGKYVLMR